MPFGISDAQWDIMTPEDQEILKNQYEQGRLENATVTPKSINALEPEKQVDKKDVELRTDLGTKNYKDIAKEYLSTPEVSEEAKQIEKKAEEFQPQWYDVAGKTLSDIGSTLGQAGTLAGGAYAGIDTSKAAKVYEGMSEDAKQRLARKEQMRQDLLAKAKSAQDAQKAKREGLYKSLGIAKGLEEEQKAQAPVAGIGKESLIKLASQKGIDISPEALQSLSTEDADKAFVTLSKLDSKNKYREITTYDAKGNAKIELVNENDPSDRRTLGVSIGKPQQKGIMEKSALVDQVKNTNQLLAIFGYALLPEDGSATNKDLSDARGLLSTSGALGVANKPTDTFSPNELIGENKKHWENVVNKAQKEDKTVLKDMEQVNLLQQTTDPTKLNPMAVNAAQRIIAQMFNKGALSENDVKAFGGSTAINERFTRWLNRNIGEGIPFNEQDLKDLRDLTDIIANNKNKLREKILGTHIREAESINPKAGNVLKYIVTGESSPQVQNLPTNTKIVGGKEYYKDENGNWKLKK